MTEDNIEQGLDHSNISNIPVSRPIGSGWTWIKDAFSIFKTSAFLWIGVSLLYLIIMVVFELIPFLGSIASILLGPVMMAGLVQCMHDQSTQGEFKTGTLFSGFSHQTGRLMASGAIFFVLILVCFIPMGLMMGLDFFEAQDAEFLDPNQADEMGSSALIGILISVALMIPAFMAYYFMPALIKLNDMTIFEAYKLSFIACLKNILPYLWYGIIITVLIMISAIPLGLGLFVTLPVAMIAMYTSYRDIFSG